jgi:lipoprotein-releasing system ATP-binding protein
MTNILQLKEISKIFDTKSQELILSNVSFTLKKGQILSLVGPSGSGKTTLLQIIGLLDTPSSGEIILNNKNITNIDEKGYDNIRRSNIGFIFQYHHLISEFNVLENVTLPLLVNNYKKDDAIKIAQKTLKDLKLDDKMSFLPSQLSGGQKQRVAIARAIVNKPDIILADEPTGNLDNKLSIEIYDIISDLVKKNNISCIFVTHNINLAKKADKIYKLENKTLSQF